MPEVGFTNLLVSDGEVTLQGLFGRADDRAASVAIVRAMPGVRRVIDRRVRTREWQAMAADLFRRLAAEAGAAERDPGLLAKGFSAMSDRLWLYMLINPKETDRDTARRVVRAFLHGLYPDHFAADAAEASTSAA